MGGAEPEAKRLFNMQRNIDVRTPESIAFSYELAGLGSRFLALVIDMLLQFGVLAALAAGIVLAATRIEPAKHVASGTEKLAGGIAVALVVFVLFAIFFGYFIVFEALWSGQTPGKRCSAYASFATAVTRSISWRRAGAQSRARRRMLLGFYAFSRDQHADVAREQAYRRFRGGYDRRARRAMAMPASLDEGGGAAVCPTRYLSGDERSLIRRFIERRETLAPQARQELAAHRRARSRSRARGFAAIGRRSRCSSAFRFRTGSCP